MTETELALPEFIECAIKSGPETLSHQRPALTNNRIRSAIMANYLHIDIETLRQLVSYDCQTGKFVWLERPLSMFATKRAYSVWNARYAGTEAFSTDANGYCKGRIFNKNYKAHRVAWALHYGEWPNGDLDHIDGNPANNSILNLRTVDHQTNMKNTKRRSDNTSGVVGVYWYKRNKTWQVKIGDAHLGYFPNYDEACSARQQAMIEGGYHPNHGRSL